MDSGDVRPHNWDMDDLKTRLLKAIDESGLTRTELADRVGVTRGAVYNWINTGTIARDTLQRVAVACKVPPDWLMFGTGSPNESLGPVVPVIGHAIAGGDGGGYFTDMGLPPGAADEFVPWSSRDPNAYALRVKGDSMRPRIWPGDLIVIEPNRAAAPGGLVLVKLTDGRKMVKVLLYRVGTDTTLGSINDDHPSITVAADEIESLCRVAAIVPPDSVVSR